jgi:modification methylase
MSRIATQRAAVASSRTVRTRRGVERGRPQQCANVADIQAVLEDLVAQHFPQVSTRPLAQTAIPRLAKDRLTLRSIETAIRAIPTRHTLHLADARLMSCVEDESVHLIVTSPPYWTLKMYPTNEAQLGSVSDYDVFLKELDRVWAECHRVLVKGGRLVVVVGDVCLSRKKHGAHMVLPLHAAIQEQCRTLRFHNLAPIIWHKIANAVFEVDNGTSFLGKPYEPNAIIKNDIEYILMQRKPGGYRKPSEAARVLSLIGEKHHRTWFNQIITVPGASTRQHPAPYPIALVERLIRMFSFVGDRVLDPFSGTGTTSVAAARWGRNSIGFEIEPAYHQMARERLTGFVKSENLQATVVDA